MAGGWTAALFAAGVGVMGASALGSVLPAASGGEGLHLVIAASAAGAEAVILRAGGTVVGPASAPFAALSGGVTAERLRQAGAWAVTGLPVPFACGEGSTE